MNTFPPQFLQWSGIFDESQMLGLLNGTLHEVLQNATSGKGQAQVSAIGLNITCGYLPAKIKNGRDGSGFNISLGTGGSTLLPTICMSPVLACLSFSLV
jgi:hypothetical protein